MKEISDRDDIIHLIDTFYDQVVDDPIIGHYFTQIMKIDWKVHKPIMYDFWESVLFGKAVYQGNAMVKHIGLNRTEKIEPHHFERWLELWSGVVKGHYTGERADMAVSRATSIAGLMQYKISEDNNRLTQLTH